MGVDLLLHHGHHVKRVSHGVEAQDPRQFLKTCPKDHKQTGITKAEEGEVDFHRDF